MQALFQILHFCRSAFAQRIQKNGEHSETRKNKAHNQIRDHVCAIFAVLPEGFDNGWNNIFHAKSRKMTCIHLYHQFNHVCSKCSDYNTEGRYKKQYNKFAFALATVKQPIPKFCKKSNQKTNDSSNITAVQNKCPDHRTKQASEKRTDQTGQARPCTRCLFLFINLFQTV